MRDTRLGYTSIAELAALSGESVPCAGNLPVKLDDPDTVWFIDQGAVNLFLVEFRDGVEQAAPQHLLRRGSGSLLPGVAPDGPRDEDDTTLSLIAKGSPGTVLKRLPASVLSDADPAELAEQTDTWLTAITDTLSRFASRLPRPTALARPGLTRTPAPCTLSVQRGVVWVSEPPRGTGLFMDLVDPADIVEAGGPHEAVIPLTRTSWLILSDEATLSGSSTETLAKQGILLSALASFHAVAFALERLNRRLAVVDDANLERVRTTSRRTVERAARQRLFNIHDLPIDRDASVEDTSLAGRPAGDRTPWGNRFQDPGALGSLRRSSRPHRRSRCVGRARPTRAVQGRGRLVARRQQRDAGIPRRRRPARGASAGMVGALPGIRSGQQAQRPDDRGSCHRAGGRGLDVLSATAGGEREAGGPAADCAAWIGADLARLVLAGLPGGLIKLVPALALGFVANQTATGGTAGQFYAVAVAVAGFGLLGALLHLLQSTAMMRIEGRSVSRVEAAFWDRLMRLPSSVLHGRRAGDLAVSGMTFQNLRDGLQGVAADGLLSVLFLLPVLGVIFLYDATLGTVALAASLASLLVTVVLGLRQIPLHGRMIRAARRVSGRLFQIVGSIGKLRVENAEASAFAIWAQDYREQKRTELELGALEGHSRAFGAALPLLAAGILLFAAVAMGDGNLPVGDFLVAYLVFAAFQSAVARLGESFGAVAAILPAFDQMRPLLAAVPEAEVEGAPVEDLGGDIVFDHVSYRYDPDGPLILDDVTIHVRPGEFVAIAGESGAGKSTLFRLALGFDRPTAGAVCYDGRDLRNLNLKQVRRRIGVVPQSVGLHPSDLWDNLVGHHDEVASGEIWAATRVADVEKEIKGMPMGMMTMVGTSGSVLSGGESQRVSIARSVIGSPRIMLLDEATNWLDNESQARVMRNLTALTSTRVVIAHRLSTLEQADRIYVLQAGKVVQSGSFNELMEADGVFRDLVRRQVA